MFMLRNVSKYLFGDTSKESIIEIPQGQLYLVRPLSPKGNSELIFRDAAASIHRTAQAFHYQLVIQRVYEEGEEELLTDEDDNGHTSTENGLHLSDKDEKGFLLDESLHFRTEVREGGETVFAWRDLSGDPGDLFEFVCDSSTQQQTVTNFGIAAVQCQYERKYRKSADAAAEKDLEEFQFEGDQPIPSASPEKSLSPSGSAGKLHSDEMANTASKRSSPGSKSISTALSAPATKALSPGVPPSAKNPEGRETLATEHGELHFYDFEQGAFVLQDGEVDAKVVEVGNWNYWLSVRGKNKDWLGQPVVSEINPVFNFEYLSCIFNVYTEDGSAYSWLMRFRDQKTLERFQEGLMQALWEHLNQIKWLKSKDDDREYVLEAFNDLTMEDAPEEEDDEPEVEEPADGERDEQYDSDESQDDVDVHGKDKEANSQLAVGYKHDRSFVVRGSKIGVFKHTPDNHLQFSTNISKIQTPKGKLFSPKKIMLHAEDSDMILQNTDNPNSLYRLDLEYGKIVDEWKVHDDIPVKSFAPSQKYAQMTSEPTFIGLSGNALYRIDPRLSGNKLVDADLKQYASKNAFSAAATTKEGYLAVASDKGDVRLFDRLGINAKTLLPALGDPIVGIDVSADGRWVLTTSKTYLLLIDAMQKEGKNVGKLGFEKSFGKDSKPQPRRLTLSPSHVAQMNHETRGGVSFTPAHFNTGLDITETTIVTATGPFVVTWSMKKILKGIRDPYSIKRYSDSVQADDFKYGTDKNLIVTLPNEVNMINKSALRKPTRESIVGNLPQTPRRSGTRGSYLRNEIVNSPY